MRLAGIDIGTNTLRLLIVDSPNGEWKEIFSDRQVTRLGEGFSQNRRLADPAIQRTAEVLKSFYNSIQRFRCDEILAVATSAVREAGNQNEFLALIKKEIPLDIRVISGDEEARLTWLGIRQAVASPTDSQILIDIGGGCTEWILADHEKIVNKISLPLGVVFLTEEYLLSDPPLPAELERMKKKISGYLTSVKEKFGMIMERSPRITWIGTAGTITTLAAMVQELEEYSFEKINGFVLTQTMVSGLYETLLSRTKGERKGIKGLERGREDIILAGTAILLESMGFFNFNQIVVSDYGLREGIIIDRLQQLN
jgi:exopolyphosphatase/guanosine-5'-triphosphate,3'-diphosphate pyrophosphatase